MIERTCRELAVSLYPAGGFSSLTLVYDAALHINESTADGEIPARVIYIGDYDPAGVLIDQSIHSEFQKHLHPDVDLDFLRLAVTPGQIRELKLPTKPRKATEQRAQHVHTTVEAEAIPTGTLRAMLREEIEVNLPAGAMEATRAAEESERAMIGWAADNLAAS